jgi:hypothetical protein
MEFEAASKAIAAWAPVAMPRRIRVEKRTIRARQKNPHPGDFTRYRVKALFEVLFWQGLFIIVIKVRRNKLLHPYYIG